MYFDPALLRISKVTGGIIQYAALPKDKFYAKPYHFGAFRRTALLRPLIFPNAKTDYERQQPIRRDLGQNRLP